MNFLRSDKYEQVYLLTHSLYFFYEMTDLKGRHMKTRNFSELEKTQQVK